MFKGLIALVTGGGSGLGRATVERLAKEGSHVVCCDLPGSKAEKFVSELGSESVIFSPADITSSDDVKRTVSLIETNFGKLNLLVNCAGVSVAFKTYNFLKNRGHDLDDFRRVQTVNVVGTFNVIAQAVRLMGCVEPDSEGSRGLIVNTTSTAAFEGQMGQVAYSASSGALAGMTLPLARDFALQGIRVNSIAVGLFDTPLLSVLPDKVQHGLAQLTPFPKRLGKPEEFADLVCCMFNNRMLNGEIIRLDGGLRLVM